MREVATVILAAGLAPRMGSREKQRLPIGDMTMVAPMAATYRAATQGPVIVVTEQTFHTRSPRAGALPSPTRAWVL